MLAPALGSGQIVVMDNLGAHRPKKIKEFIEERGYELLYLPSYSPDLNPLEEAHPEDDERPHQGCPDRGDGRGAGSRECQGRTRFLCLLRLPNPGAAAMKGAVSERPALLEA